VRAFVVRVVLVAALAATPAAGQSPPALVIEAPSSLAAERARLEAYDLRPLADIVRLVGLAAPGPPMRVVLATADSPWAAQVSPWVAGLAIGEDGPIVLFPARSPTYPHDTLEDVLRHEVAHLLISRAAAGQRVPRWFHEGLAVAVERPWGLEDRTRLASQLLFGPRLDFAAIDRLFTGDQGTQARAYSLSAAIVRDLIDAHGRAVPAAILRAAATGVSFDTALSGVTGRSIPRLEQEFWDRQRTWTMWVPIVASTSALWLVVIALAALAVRRRRQRAAAIRHRWAQEEAAAALPGLNPAPSDGERSETNAKKAGRDDVAG
jgi:hypothetical protein